MRILKFLRKNGNLKFCKLGEPKKVCFEFYRKSWEPNFDLTKENL